MRYNVYIYIACASLNAYSTYILIRMTAITITVHNVTIASRRGGLSHNK